MKIEREIIEPSEGSSFKLLLTPRLNDTFLWHFHPEYEIVYVEGASGTRHVGAHISGYEKSDLVFIGPHIPHLNFDYGVPSDCEQVIVQMKENFLGKDFLNIPELEAVKDLFERSVYGLSFYGHTKEKAGVLLKKMQEKDSFGQLLILLEIFQLLAHSKEVHQLNSAPAGNRAMEKEQHRIGKIYQYIESQYHLRPDVNEAAKIVHMSTAAFCRFFKRNTRMTFTDFVNQYRINQARNLLLQDKSITEICYAVGIESISYFNKLFRQTVGENPSSFRKKFAHGLSRQ